MTTTRALLRLLALGAVVVGTAAPVSASPEQPAATGCRAAARAVSTETSRPDDGVEMSPATARAVDRAVHSPANRRAARNLPGTIVIPVRAHIITGTHRRDRHATLVGVRRQIAALNTAYAGGEQPADVVPLVPTANTSFRFRLRSVDKTRNDRWFHVLPGPRANQMKKALHQGRQYTLNIYFVEFPRVTGLLGYATFPYQYARHPRLDGLVVNDLSLPGGPLAHFDQGDTAVHEIGHWLGLRHVFNDQAVGSTETPDPSDCAVDNDGIADTPIQAYPSTGCPEGADSCQTDGAGRPDSIHNFMDYSYDECMYQFTQGQSDTMDLNWARYRRP